MRVWNAAPCHNLSFPKDRGWSALSLLWCESSSTGKLNWGPFSGSFTCTCISSLPLSFSFPHLGAALHSSSGSKLLPGAFAAPLNLLLPKARRAGPEPAWGWVSVCPQGRSAASRGHHLETWHVTAWRHSWERAEQCVQCLLAVCLASAKGIDC